MSIDDRVDRITRALRLLDLMEEIGEVAIAERDELRVANDVLRIQNNRLRAALLPFSEMAGELFEDNWNSSDHVFLLDSDSGLILTAGHFFDARMVVAEMGHKP